MKANFWCKLALSGLISIVSSGQAWSHPEIFSDLSLEQAKQEAAKNNKFLLIDFTASWCPPCRRMEASTWTNATVQDWIKANAVAIQIDVDKDEKTSAELHVEAMPTMVLFKPQDRSTEFGRQVGYMDSSELLQWLEGIKSGKSDQEIAKEANGSNGNEVFEHVTKAQNLQAEGKNDEACEEYLWIWNNVSSNAPNIGQIRTGLVPNELKRLALTSPTVRTKCGALRDAAEKSNNRNDWIILNGILNENVRTLAWFDKAKLDPNLRTQLQKQSTLIEPVLCSEARWNDIVTYLYPDPIAKLNEYFKRAQEMKKPSADTEVSKTFDPFPTMVMTIYAAYIGAGKNVEAQKIASECMRLDDSADMKDSLNRIETIMKTVGTTPAKPAK